VRERGSIKFVVGGWRKEPEVRSLKLKASSTKLKAVVGGQKKAQATANQFFFTGFFRAVSSYELGFLL